MSVIQNIGLEQAPIVAVKAGAAVEPSFKRVAAAPSAGAGGGENVVHLSNEAVDIAALQEAKNGLNEAAKGIRTADGSMRQIIDYIDRMKADLRAITKHYPPYPPGSEERVSFLKSFSVFRKEIEKLTFSSPEYGGDTAAAGEVAEVPQS